MAKEDINYTYYFKGIPFAAFVAKEGIHLSGKLLEPFDILIVGLPNYLSLEEDINKPPGSNPFKFETVGDIKQFLFDTDTYVVKKN